MTQNATCWGNCTTTFAGKTANVLSLNIDILPEEDLSSILGLALDTPLTSMRTEAIAKGLAGYDVVGLQEL